MKTTWEKAQAWETLWHDKCINTYGEEFKQLMYANKMGLKTFHNSKSPFNFDLNTAKVLDIGGGPTSLLLKCVNVQGTIIEPMHMPQWVNDRYKCAGIKLITAKAENVIKTKFDEVWIYNCLQHTENPQTIINNALHAGKTIRIFEWINTKVNDGHLHNLTEEKLNMWLKGEGKIEMLTGQSTCTGWCYYGVFEGDLYAT